MKEEIKVVGGTERWREVEKSWRITCQRRLLLQVQPVAAAEQQKDIGVA